MSKNSYLLTSTSSEDLLSPLSVPDIRLPDFQDSDSMNLVFSLPELPEEELNKCENSLAISYKENKDNISESQLSNLPEIKIFDDDLIASSSSDICGDNTVEDYYLPENFQRQRSKSVCDTYTNLDDTFLDSDLASNSTSHEEGSFKLTKHKKCIKEFIENTVQLGIKKATSVTNMAFPGYEQQHKLKIPTGLSKHRRERTMSLGNVFAVIPRKNEVQNSGNEIKRSEYLEVSKSTQSKGIISKVRKNFSFRKKKQISKEIELAKPEPKTISSLQKEATNVENDLPSTVNINQNSTQEQNNVAMDSDILETWCPYEKNQLEPEWFLEDDNDNYEEIEGSHYDQSINEITRTSELPVKNFALDLLMFGQIGLIGRRLSHDVGTARRQMTDSIVPWLRGKSRSVDHAIHTPFDLNALRKKIGERTSSEPTRGPPYPSPDTVDGSKENIAPTMGIRSETPPLTITYTVQANDTLMSIAAHFETTPSELTKLNRLTTRFLFPGQPLLVPDKSASHSAFTADVATQEKEISDSAEQIVATVKTPKLPLSPLNYPPTPANSVDTEKSIDKECLQKFLKIEVKHITDGQGVVSGVLLVTPNAVMFDPNVSDPLVIEHGSESYGVIAPMEYVVNAALYYDIAHMRVRDTNIERPNIPKPEIYFGPLKGGRGGENSLESPNKDASLSKDVTFSELVGSQDDNESTCSCGGESRETSAFPKAFDQELITPVSSEISLANVESHSTTIALASVQSITSENQHSASTDQPSENENEAAVYISQMQNKGELTPIAEASKLEDICMTPAEEIKDIAQSDCDKTLAQKDLSATSMSDNTVSNEKKRTTSITFDSSLDEEQVHTSVAAGNIQNQESRKQKVLKRLSYPLSWMEGLGGEKDTLSQNVPPPSAPPISVPATSSTGDSTDVKSGMFMNMFNMSNVSNMLTSSPKYLVDFSSGIFARSPSEGTGLVRDISELGSSPGSLENISTGHSHSPNLSRKAVFLNTDKEERRGIHIRYPGRPSLDFARIPVQHLANLQVGSMPSHTGTTAASSVEGSRLQYATKRAQYKEGPKFGLKSMVSMDDMPELFASFDKLIPKPAQSNDDPPLYLCMRIGKQKDKKIPRSTPIMSYGKKAMRTEYWFSIPKCRSDDLYHFFMLWYPEIYGELNEEKLALKGIVLVDEDTDLFDNDRRFLGGEGGISVGEELSELTKESWDVVSMSDELRCALYSSNSLTSLELDLFLPELFGTTEIITDSMRKSLYKKLPARAQCCAWKLVFSSSQHGFSLNTLYRKMACIDSHILLFIEDTVKNVFGGLLSCPLKVSDLFYGTGECFLFTCEPDFNIFPWSGENTFCVKGNEESLIVGGGDGTFALWLDGDLYQGRTQSSKTFNNPPLSSSEDFIVKTLECWCFE